MQLPGPAAKVLLLGVSCPSKSFCVASGTNNLIASSTDPTGGPGAWNVVYAGEGPWPKSAEWNTPFISGRQIQGISCPSAQLCVGVTDQGDIYTSTQPGGPASSWQTTEIDAKGRNTHLFGVSCPSVSLCVAVSGKRADQGKILASTDPTGGTAAWHTIELGEPLEFRGVSCGSVSFCVAVTNEGRIVTSTEPLGGPSAWQVIGQPGGPGGLHAVACVAAALCVSGNQGGNIFSSQSPAAGLSSWRGVSGGGSVQITGISCPSASECLAVDDNGSTLISKEPSAGKSAWSYSNLIPFAAPTAAGEIEGNALFAASCPSSSMCAVAGTLGQIFTNTAPFEQSTTPSGPRSQGRSRVRRPRAKIALLHLPGRRRIKHNHGPIVVRFYAEGGARRFECRLDHRPFKTCRSPNHYLLAVGRHVFAVRAIGATGLAGPTVREVFFIGHHCSHGPAGPRTCQLRTAARQQ